MSLHPCLFFIRHFLSLHQRTLACESPNSLGWRDHLNNVDHEMCFEVTQWARESDREREMLLSTISLGFFFRYLFNTNMGSALFLVLRLTEIHKMAKKSHTMLHSISRDSKKFSYNVAFDITRWQNSPFQCYIQYFLRTLGFLANKGLGSCEVRYFNPHNDLSCFILSVGSRLLKSGIVPPYWLWKKHIVNRTMSYVLGGLFVLAKVIEKRALHFTSVPLCRISTCQSLFILFSIDMLKIVDILSVKLRDLKIARVINQGFTASLIQWPWPPQIYESRSQCRD